MEIALKTNKTRYRFDEVICCTITRVDISPAQEWDQHGYCGFLINGHTAYYEESDIRRFQPILWDYWDAIGTVYAFDFQVEVKAGSYPNILSTTSAPLRIEVDLTGIEVLNTSTGEPSCYVRHHGVVYFVWHGSRGHGKAYRTVPVDSDSARVLSNQQACCHYLVDDQHVFRNGCLIKEVKADGFKVFNHVFAGDAHAILTPYGNAKVMQPEHFEPLDDGDQYNLKKAGLTSCKAGYGRDGVHAYWFDSSNSTAHAIIVKACKQAHTFVSLGLGFAKDKDHVYLEGRRIKGADPSTWQMINRLFSRDKKSVYYLTEKVVDADPATFEIIAADDEDDLFDSMYARDQFNTFKRWVKM